MENASIDLNRVKKIHFIGIGGISMSGLARILAGKGLEVTGSDMRSSLLTEKLSELGIKIYIGHDSSNIEDPDLVVYTSAISDNNTELKHALSQNIPVIDRACLLGLIMKNYESNFAISGTHGKTTTTAMVSMILMEAGLDPTIHIGGELDYIGGSVRSGNSKYFVTEACEYKDNFHKLFPKTAVILNVDLDHIDYFKDIEQMKESFAVFANRVPKDGLIIISGDDENLMSLRKKIKGRTVTFGIYGKGLDYHAEDIVFDPSGSSSYTLCAGEKKLTKIELNVLGIHNVYNSLAACATCIESGCGTAAVKQGLGKFLSTHRRFELKGFYNGAKVIDDYAHHPSEIKATLNAAKGIKADRIWCVFQPHTYTRTKSFLEDFAISLAPADHVILADIYAAREDNVSGVTSVDLTSRINALSGNALFIQDFHNICEYLKNHVHENDLIITMGAGDIYKVAEELTAH